MRAVFPECLCSADFVVCGGGGGGGPAVDPLMYHMTDAADQHASKDFSSMVKEIFDYCLVLESTYKASYQKFVLHHPELPPHVRLSWVTIIMTHLPRFDLETFKTFAAVHCLPELTKAVQIVNQSGPRELARWAVQYRTPDSLFFAICCSRPRHLSLSHTLLQSWE